MFFGTTEAMAEETGAPCVCARRVRRLALAARGEAAAREARGDRTGLTSASRMDRGVSSFLALRSPRDAGSESPRAEHAKTDPR